MHRGSTRCASFFETPKLLLRSTCRSCHPTVCHWRKYHRQVKYEPYRSRRSLSLATAIVATETYHHPSTLGLGLSNEITSNSESSCPREYSTLSSLSALTFLPNRYAAGQKAAKGAGQAKSRCKWNWKSPLKHTWASSLWLPHVLTTMTKVVVPDGHSKKRNKA